MSWEFPDPDAALLTPREVAEMFGVRTTAVARWSRLGILEHTKTPGGHRRYRLGDVRTLLDKKSMEDPSERGGGNRTPDSRGDPIGPGRGLPAA